MGFNLQAFDSALMTQIVAATAALLPDGQAQVVFANQNARAPNEDYVTVKPDGPFSVGTGKALVESYDNTQPQGQEVGKTYQGPAEMRLSIQAFTVGFENAIPILEAIQMAFQTRPVLDALETAGITVIDHGRIQSVPKVYGSDMEGRAVLEMRLYVQQSITVRTGYIAKINGAAPLANGTWNPASGGPTGTFTE